MPLPLHDDALEIIEAVSDFIHSCDDVDQRKEVRRLLVLACHTLKPISEPDEPDADD